MHLSLRVVEGSAATGAAAAAAACAGLHKEELSLDH